MSLPQKPWSLPVAQVLQALDTDAREGLSPDEAAARLRQFGPNRLELEAPSPWWRLLLAQFTDLLVLLLLAAAAISVAVGQMEDAVLIAVIVAANAGIGFFQELQAQQAIQALKQLTRPKAHVWRQGQLMEIAAEELVPGDLLELTAGTILGADARVVEASDLTADESPLTGESLPVEKRPEPVPEDAPLADRRSMLHAGTAVLTGRGRAVVVATGMETQLGRIARMVHQARPEPTPLQQRLAQLSRTLAVAVVVICVVVFVAGYLRSHIDARTMFLSAVSLAVAAIPEGLPAVITVTLALAARRMARRHAIVRQLPAVETLGSVDVICSDKTGTMTQGRMEVARTVPVAEVPQWETRLLEAAVLCNDAQLAPDGTPQGTPTENALVAAAQRAGIDVALLRSRWARLDEVPFSSARKRMATLHRTPQGQRLLLVKGAAEQVLARCQGLCTPEGNRPWDQTTRDHWDRLADHLADQGYRVLAVACRSWPEERLPHDAEAVERELWLLGLLALMDPLRPEVPEAVARCRSAGIQVKMITGDHARTARTIAAQAGLLEAEAEVVTGAELDRMEEEELRRRMPRIGVFARVAPAHKLRIVRALQAQDHVVAMTGDGVNDAPALKQADIGVAMGQAGTDVSKEAARMVLADDNFATIVAAVEQGRVVYDNIRKFVQYLLTANAAEVLVLFLGVMAGWPLPLLPVHLLWINLVTDGLPALALGFEPPERDVMRRRPRPRNESIFAGGVGTQLVAFAAVMTTGVLGVFWWYLPRAVEADSPEVRYARTLVFFTLAVMQLFFVLGLRRRGEPIWHPSTWHNPLLWGSVGVGLALQLATVYVPVLQPWFRTVPLSGADLGVAVAVAAVPLVLLELWKLAARSVHSGRGERGK